MKVRALISISFVAIISLCISGEMMAKSKKRAASKTTSSRKTTKKKNAKHGLKVYRARRDLSRSPEPKGGTIKSSKGEPIFVVQKHDASHLHYDVRLEIGGVLVSWAVPKGPSVNPTIKRLAMPTDDHPMEYAHFEGNIPVGSYGAGSVMVWDLGTFENIKEEDGTLVPLKKCLERGTVEIFLKGKKLYGRFALIKTQRGWLMIKMRDEYANKWHCPTKERNKSVLTGRTQRQIAKEGKKTKKGKK